MTSLHSISLRPWIRVWVQSTNWLSVSLTLQVSLDDRNNHSMLSWYFFNFDFMLFL